MAAPKKPVVTGKKEAKTSVLVVDDERGVRESLRFLLERYFDVVTVESGDAALKALGAQDFAVVVLDLAMPGLSGLQTLAKIRKTNTDVEVVISTGFGSKESEAEIARLRAFDLVTKPFDSARIVSIVRAAANARRKA